MKAPHLLVAVFASLLLFSERANAEIRAELEAMKFWDTPQGAQAFPPGTKLTGLTADVLEKQVVTVTPRVHAILENSGRYLEALFAPGVLPEGYVSELLPIHSERFDYVRLPRFLWQGWVLEVTVSSNSVAVTAYHQEGKRAAGPDEMAQLALGLARGLFVGEKTLIPDLKLARAGGKTPYGYSGFLDQTRPLNPEEVMSRRRPLDEWPYNWPNVIGFRTDGRTVAIGIIKPEGPRSEEGVGMRPRSDWFAGTEQERLAEPLQAQ